MSTNMTSALCGPWDLWYRVYTPLINRIEPKVIHRNCCRESQSTWRLGTGTTRSSAKKNASSSIPGGKRKPVAFALVLDLRHQVLKSARACRCDPCSASGQLLSTTKYDIEIFPMETAGRYNLLAIDVIQFGRARN